MKKRQITINEYSNHLGSYTIIIDNARYHKNFSQNIVNLIKQFTNDDEMFFGFYRIDGLNLTLKEQKKLEKEIPCLFQKHGEIKIQNDYLSIAKAKITDCIYNSLASIFDYHLETILFNSKVNWETFQKYHFDYQNHRYDDYIINNFTDILFYYFDSGDFSVCFNSKKYTPENMRDIIQRIWL